MNEVSKSAKKISFFLAFVFVLSLMLVPSPSYASYSEYNSNPNLIGINNPSGNSPAVVTNAANNVTPSSATLNGFVDGNYLYTSAWFEWSSNANILANQTPHQYGFGASGYSATINVLNPGTTYYFRAVSHGSPEVVGEEKSVKTANPPAPPAPTGGGGGNGPVVGSFGGGGGGGGGGAGFYYFGQSQGSVLGASTTASSNGTGWGQSAAFKFLKNLRKGMKHGDVSELQKRLIAEGFLTLDVPTNYFGTLTEAAVKAFQGKHGVEAVGNVGPKTRAALNGDSGMMTGGTIVPSMSDNAKEALMNTLKAKLKELMDKIAALMASSASSNPSSTATSTPELVASSTPAVTASSTATTTQSY